MVIGLSVIESDLDPVYPSTCRVRISHAVAIGKRISATDRAETKATPQSSLHCRPCILLIRVAL
jgi:hypothetical protein